MNKQWKKTNVLAKMCIVGLLVSLLFVGCAPRHNTDHQPDPESVFSEETMYIATKNTSRIVGSSAEEISISTSRMIWPSTNTGTRPNVVLVAPVESWQAQLIALNLVHHPSDGPLLVTSQSDISDSIMNELMRLNPLGAEDGTQVIAVGMEDTAVELLAGHFQVYTINADNIFGLAREIDTYYAEISGELPLSVIISTAENAAYALPAGAWISHMPEPLLYVTQADVPGETREALEKRQGKANIYLLGPEDAINPTVEDVLRQYGSVVRIAGDNPITNSIKFAQYYDQQTGFGWNISKPGHGIILANSQFSQESIAASALAHRGKHAPMLLTEAGQAPKQLSAYLGELKPLFQQTPTEGPYNHLYIVGLTNWISWEQQGDLDHLVEIESADGEGHGAHGNRENQNTNQHPMNNGTMNH
ncbi:hypothetical protein BHU72_06610 [Desulfuribacillus stibiiarsenatis]|uniref:Cell wall-binding repeat 2 family protein n=1 Tax=Desulfuribacillus stibiiarsenatis TaxID=1390249 RepID=A0A1E5L445_9FIRM|nr:cell wall-binding repeat-containing protein [Desulfuribacillus stibiiarsenatis]OEH84861.1 hypothetical protein BHU72_06610 [Desulfuribacillus stibiiarsenatis]